MKLIDPTKTNLVKKGGGLSFKNAWLLFINA